MSHEFVTSDISGQFIFLGTGTSVGVPAIGCGCDVCRSSNPRNRRTRCAVAIGLPEGNLLIDTPPDLRTQLLREDIGIIHSVLFTHEHADHIFGLDDLRLFPFRLNAPVPLYCEPQVEARIRHSFDYAFQSGPSTHAGARPELAPKTIGLDAFTLLGAKIQPIRLLHGPNYQVLGFRIGNIGYCTDTNFIPDESIELLRGCEIFIVDGLRRRPHPTHFHVDGALEAIERVAPQRALLTHVCHELEYEKTCSELPANVDLAYDGMRLELKL